MKNFVMDAKIDPRVCDGSVHISKLVDGTFCNQVIENCWNIVWMRMNRGC